MQVSVCRYVLSGEIADCSEALQRLLEVDILSRMTRHTMFASPDYFRKRHLYIDSTSGTLARHEATLRTLFSAVAIVAPASKRPPKHTASAESKLLLSFRGWLAFLQAVRLIDLDLSEREAALAWAWSRTAVVDEATAWGHVQATHLPFTGFCEALCRVATLKALPTEEEVAFQFSNAHQFLTFHEQNSQEKYAEFLEHKSAPWGAEPSRQPVEACFKHLLAIIVGRIAGDVDETGLAKSFAESVRLTDKECKEMLADWCARWKLGPVHGRDRY